jgi:hypothetical protein
MTENTRPTGGNRLTYTLTNDKRKIGTLVEKLSHKSEDAEARIQSENVKCLVRERVARDEIDRDIGMYRAMTMHRDLRELLPHLIAYGEVEDGTFAKVFELQGRTGPVPTDPLEHWKTYGKPHVLLAMTMWRHGFYFERIIPNMVTDTVPLNVISFQSVNRFSSKISDYLARVMQRPIADLHASEIPSLESLYAIPRAWKTMKLRCIEVSGLLPGNTSPCDSTHLPKNTPPEVERSVKFIRFYYPNSPRTMHGPRPKQKITRFSKKMFDQVRQLRQTGQLGGMRMNMAREIERETGPSPQDDRKMELLKELNDAMEKGGDAQKQVVEKMVKMRNDGNLPSDMEPILEQMIAFQKMEDVTPNGLNQGKLVEELMKKKEEGVLAPEMGTLLQQITSATNAATTTPATMPPPAVIGATGSNATGPAIEDADTAQRRLIEAIENGDEDAVKMILDGKFEAYQSSLLPKLQEALKSGNKNAIRDILNEEAESRRRERVVPKLIETLMSGKGDALGVLGEERYKQEVEKILPDMLNQIEEGDVDGAHRSLRKHMHRLERLKTQGSKKRSTAGGGGGFSPGVSFRGISLSSPDEQWVRRSH